MGKCTSVALDNGLMFAEAQHAQHGWVQVSRCRRLLPAWVYECKRHDNSRYAQSYLMTVVKN